MVALAVAGSVALVLVKPLAILPIGAAAVALLLGAVTRGAGIRAIVVLMLPALAALVTYQGWEVVRDARAVVPYSEVTDALLVGRPIVDEYPLDVVGTSLTELLTGYGDRVGVQPIRPAVAGFAAMIGLLLVYGPSIATALGRGRRELQHLHIGILTVALAAPVILITQSYFAVQPGRRLQLPLRPRPHPHDDHRGRILDGRQPGPAPGRGDRCEPAAGRHRDRRQHP